MRLLKTPEIILMDQEASDPDTITSPAIRGGFYLDNSFRLVRGQTWLRQD